MIVHLSSPEGSSINDGISTELSSLQYTSIDNLAALVIAVGKSPILVKADVKKAYSPVYPEDQHLLGVRWNRAIYIDKVLPYGLHSTPKIFSAVADAILWILNKKGMVAGLHYLDNFILVAQDRHAEKHILLSRSQLNHRS